MTTCYRSALGADVLETIGEWSFNEETHEFDADLGIERYEYFTVETRPLTTYVITIAPETDGSWAVTLLSRSRYGTTSNALEYAPTRAAALGIAYAYMQGKRTSRLLPP